MSAGPILFISDLHLEAQRTDISQAFYHFLEQQAAQASALFILGDFFNVWLGDDEQSDLSQAVAARLRTLSDQGLSIYLMHGNRDFLLGERYAEQCGATLIHEPCLLQAFGEKYLLMHGDVLCTKDHEYMAFRELVRQAQWQEEFLARSIDERRAFAQQARAQSKAMNSNKAEDIMDVTEDAVTQCMQEHDVRYLIHGHTHRPAVHEFALDGEKAQRLVLGDWDRQAWFARLDADGLALISS